MVSGDISHIRAGIYRETVIPESDGLTFKNYEGEYVLITGLDVISDWQPYNGGEANGNMQTPSSTKITQVFVDGKRMNWARYPNEDEDMLSTGGVGSGEYKHGAAHGSGELYPHGIQTR